ncbi:MAG: M20/M25/M40 family metallo-hydrolase, partial [Rhodobacteraceae bacterium]|nr:M20/M25/M40 family metallo-hydrolase [Paracoccaceae bacterium]
SYDEEVGCLGAPPMIERMLKNGPKPRAVVVGEPSKMKVVTGHKGITFIVTEVTGHAVHSSQLHRGVSAISVAAKLISWIDAQTQKNRETCDPENGFDPPYTTLHCGVIHGGAAHNITASECIFETDIRTVPGDVGREWVARYKDYIEKEILPPMKAISPNCAVTIREMANVPGLAPEENGDAENLVRSLTGDNGTHLVVFATEGGQFQERGLSTVICGPGSIDQAHKPDEFIEIAELAKCDQFIAGLCSKLA